MNMLTIAALATGGASALLYLIRRRWTDAALALAAGAALAALLGIPAATPVPATVTLDTGRPGAALQAGLLMAPQAEKLAATGDGLPEAAWRDLPPRPLSWQPPRTDALALAFERTVPLGRTFALTVTRSTPRPGWRLQLLAANGVVLDEAVARNDAALTVRWLPPVAENLVLQARLLDARNAVFAQGPVPVRIVDAVPLQVVGRFGAPSFDTRTLNDLLATSGALLDWRTVLGKAVTRSEQPAEPLGKVNLLVTDGAYFEQQGAGRAALLDQAAQGVPLLILGGNARAPDVWRRLGLPVAVQSATTEKEDTRHVAIAGTVLALPSVGLLPAGWTVLARDDDGKPYLWQRAWRDGDKRARILWLGVAQWHRHAITARAPLGQWWQRVLDHAAAGTPGAVTWTQPDPFPLPALRTELCADGVRENAPVRIGAATLPWQARADHAGAHCVAWWPERSGWFDVTSGAARTQVYVYGVNDWPAWQAGLRRQATARYAARALPAATPAAAAQATVPAWPFALLCAGALLGLWWRERR